MWYFALVGLWVMRGGTMDTKPTDLPAVMHAPRTIQDVEAELVLNAAVVAQERARFARQWPSRITDHYANHETPAVRRHNALIDEWAWWRYDDQPVVTRTGMRQPVEG